MKKLFILVAAMLFSFSALSQSTVQVFPQSASEPKEGASYKLFPTVNMWTFIKLDTRNGRLWQVQFSVENADYRYESPLSLVKRVETNEEINGRFTLYPTENYHTFIMLDQIDGRTWQVQWATEPKNRGVVFIPSPY